MEYYTLVSGNLESGEGCIYDEIPVIVGNTCSVGYRPISRYHPVYLNGKYVTPERITFMTGKIRIENEDRSKLKVNYVYGTIDREIDFVNKNIKNA